MNELDRAIKSARDGYNLALNVCATTAVMSFLFCRDYKKELSRYVYNNFPSAYLPSNIESLAEDEISEILYHHTKEYRRAIVEYRNARKIPLCPMVLKGKDVAGEVMEYVNDDIKEVEGIIVSDFLKYLFNYRKT